MDLGLGLVNSSTFPHGNKRKEKNTSTLSGLVYSLSYANRWKNEKKSSKIYSYSPVFHLSWKRKKGRLKSYCRLVKESFPFHIQSFYLFLFLFNQDIFWNQNTTEEMSLGGRKESTIVITLHEMSAPVVWKLQFGNNSIPLSIWSANLENSETNLKKLATIIWSKTSFSAQLAALKVSSLLI